MPPTKRSETAAATAASKKQKQDELADTDEENSDVETTVKPDPEDKTDSKSLINLTPKKKVASPSKLGRRSSDNDDLRNALQSCVVIIVAPKCTTGTPAIGILFAPKGYMMDKWMAEPFYLDRSDKVKLEYISLLGCVPWVMNGLKDKHGNLIAKMVNAKEFAFKALANLTDKIPTEDEVVSLVNDTISPSIWNNYLRDSYSVRKNRGQEKNLPKMVGQGRDNMWTVTNWSDAIHVPEEIFQIGDSMSDGGLVDWLRQDKNHLYQLFHEGEVPVEYYKEKNYPMEYLRPLDRERYLALSDPDY